MRAHPAAQVLGRLSELGKVVTASSCLCNVVKGHRGVEPRAVLHTIHSLHGRNPERNRVLLHLLTGCVCAVFNGSFEAPRMVLHGMRPEGRHLNFCHRANTACLPAQATNGLGLSSGRGPTAAYRVQFYTKAHLCFPGILTLAGKSLFSALTRSPFPYNSTRKAMLSEGTHRSGGRTICAGCVATCRRTESSGADTTSLR